MNPPNEENFRISMPTAKGKVTGGVNAVSNTFPDGLRVLAVDDDSTCLLVLTKMLQNCHYNVTQCQRAKDALSILYEGRSKFDIVISDVHMPDMDGFRLLEIISLEMDLPVVMMSADDKKDVVMKVIIQGACDYLMKPVRMEAIQFLWQHVVRKQKIGLKSLVQLKNLEHGEVNPSQSNDNQHTSLGNKENCESSNGRKDQVDEQANDRDDTVSLKKPRMVWSSDLHEKFVAAVNQIGFKNAVPKKILELMNDKRLTRENVASHLQKYRLYRGRNNENLQHGSKFSLPQGHSQELILNGTSSLDCCNLQSQATSSELPQQSLTILQADLERSNAVCVGQRKFYNYGMEESMPDIGQQSSSYGRGVNLSQEIIQSEQLMPSIRSGQDLGYKNVQTKDGFANNNAYGNDGLPLVMQNPFKVRRLNGTAGEEDYSYGVTYYPLSLPSTLIDFPNAHVTKLSERGFPLESTPPASFMSNRNQEYYNSDSSYEPVLGIERFDQAGLHIRPLDEQCVGRVEAKSIFDGYPTNNSYI